MTLILLRILAIFVVICSLFLIGSALYCKLGIFKKFYHDIFGWHIPSNELTFDGCNMLSKCKHCGKHIIQDSQGNWF